MFSAESFDEYKDIHDENEKIVKELERLSMDDKFLFDYDHENVQQKILNSYIIEAREEGYSEGRNEGAEQRNIEIAKNLLHQKIDVEVISKATKLSIDDINKLKEES